MTVSRYLLLSYLLVASISSVASAQSAASNDAREQASQHFSRGVDLFQEEAYRGALVEFQRAYALSPDYRLLYNIAQSKLQLQDYLGAAQSYEAYLAEGGSGVPSDRRSSVEAALAALRDRIASIRVAANRDGVDVFLDDVRIGTTPLTGPVLTNVGRHRLSARAKDGATDAHVVDVAGGDVTDVMFDLAPVAVAKTVVVREVESKGPMSRGRKGAIASWASGGALLIGGAIVATLTSGAEDDLAKQLKTIDVSQKAVADQRGKVRTLALTTDLLIGTGAAAVVAGTLLWMLSEANEAPTKSDTASASTIRVGAGLGSLTVSGQF